MFRIAVRKGYKELANFLYRNGAQKLILHKEDIQKGKLNGVYIKDIEEIYDILHLDYPIQIQHVVDINNEYYVAYFPDLGVSTFSCVGQTEYEAINSLLDEKEEMFDYLYENNFNFPEPSIDNFFKNNEDKHELIKEWY